MLGDLKRFTAIKGRGVLAKTLGTLQSLKLATGPLTAVMMRALYSTIASAFSWNCFVNLDQWSMDEVAW